MKSKITTYQTVFLLILCGGLFLIGMAGLQDRLPGLIFPFMLRGNHANALSQLCMLYALVVLIILILNQFYFSNGTSLVSKTRMLFGEVAAFIKDEQIPALRESLSSFHDVSWLVISVLIGIFVRAYFLSQPIRYDEAYTFLRFVNNGFANLFYYPVPNNHVLNTLLVKLSTLVWGNNPVAIRLPAFFAGVLSIPLLYFLCRSMQGSGIFATVMASISPYLILYSTNGRGYTLLVLLALILALIGAQISKRGASAAGDILLSSVAALGIFTIPSMLFPIAGVYAWVFCLLLIKGQSLKTVFFKYVIPTGFLTILFTIVLYTPVIFVSNGFNSIIANRYVQSLSWPVFINLVYPHFQNTLRDFFRDIPAVMQYAGLILLITGLAGALRKRNWGIVLILPMLILGATILVFLQRVVPFNRTWIFMLPFMLLCADSGLSFIFENIPSKIRIAATGVIFAAGAVFSLSLISTNAINNYPDTGTFPEAPLVVGYLSPLLRGNATVFSSTPANYPLAFYLWADRVNVDKSGNNHIFERTFFVVERPYYSLNFLTKDRVIKILDFGDATVYQSNESNPR